MKKWFLVAAGLTVFFVLLPCPQRQSDVLWKVEEAYNLRNAAGLMRWFADDVVLEVDNLEIARGKADILEVIGSLHARNSRIHFRDVQSGDRVISGKMAESNHLLVQCGVGKACGSFRAGWDDRLIHSFKIDLEPDTREELHRIYPDSADQSAGSVDLRKWASHVGERYAVGEKGIASKDFAGVMDLIGVESGMVIADIGAGEGEYAFLLSERVGGSGRIFCVEIKRRFLRKIQNRCAQDKTANVFTVLGGKTDPRLPEAVFDMIFLRHSLHCMREPGEWLKNARRYFYPRTRLVIIDGDPDILGTGWEYEHTREEVISMAERAGYELESLETDLLPDDYIYIFSPKADSRP